VGAINSGISTWRQTSTPSGLPAITPDGSKVAFFSYATGMVPGVPTNSLGEVYLYDLAASNMFWVSSNAFALSGFDSNSSPYFLSYHPAITQDGRFVSFKLSAYNSVGSAAIFEYDLSSNSLALVTTNALPPAYNDDIYGPEMTPDGRFITYASGVSTGSNTPPSSVYLTDMQAGTNYLVSICQDGSFPTNSMSHSAVVSSNGQFVAFLSNASNLVPNTVSSGYHVYLRDTFAGTTTLVDADTNGVGSSDEYGTAPALSTDGRWVAFTTPDGALFPRDNNHALDVVMRDAVSGTNELISCRNNSCPSFSADGLTPGSQFSITPDGRWAVFSSYADDLVPNDSNQNQDVFVRDLHNGTTTLVSAGLDGNPALGGESGSPVISTNGRYVAFASFATNLVPNYTNPLGGVFVRDLLNGTNILVSVATNGITPGNGSSLFPAMSQDGRYIIFLSTAANLLKTSATAGWNVYWRDMISGYTLGLVTNFPSGNSYLFPPSISADGRYVAYNSSSSGTLTVWDAQKTNNLWSASATSAVISPMGDRVLFQSGSSLYVMNVTNKTSTSWATTTSPVQGKAPWSADGRYFTYVVSSSGASQVYLGDLGSGTSTLLSTAPDHVTSGNGLSDNPALSGDARFILYRSSSTNLSSGILPASFVVSCERATGSNTVLTTGTSGDWNSYASQPVADGTGQTFLFQSVQSGLVTSDLNRLPDLFALMSDSDSDGIPDWWMLQYFGHSTGQASDSSRAQDDADGDGFTNLQEFLTGTNPTDPSSFFHLDVSTLVSNQTILLSWPAVSGRSYQLQYTTDLSNPAWSNLGDPIVAEPTGTMAISPSQPAVFYRIIAY
jgi:Tol biopolymer transport system component